MCKNNCGDKCTCPKPCGCEKEIPIKCITGFSKDITALGISKGDSLELVICKITDYILSPLNTNTVSNAQILEVLTDNPCTIQTALDNANCSTDCENPQRLLTLEYDCITRTTLLETENTQLVTIFITGNNGNSGHVVIPEGTSNNLNLTDGQTYEVNLYSNSGCDVVTVQYLINCSTQTCNNPISGATFAYDCDTNEITIGGSNILNVSITGLSGSYENGDLLPVKLTDGQTYIITFNPSDTACDTFELNYTVNCPDVSTPISLANILYSCGTTTTTITGNYTSSVGIPNSVNFLEPSVSLLSSSFGSSTFSFEISNLDLSNFNPLIFSISNGGGSSDNYSVVYGNDCCNDVLISNPELFYTCSNGFLTYSDDNAPNPTPIDYVELFDSSNNSIGQFSEGNTYSIADGTYTAKWEPKDINCPSVTTTVVIDCNTNDLQITNYSVDCNEGVMVLSGTYSSNEPLISINTSNSSASNEGSANPIVYTQSNFNTSFDTINNLGTFSVELQGGIVPSNVFDITFTSANHSETIIGVTACDAEIGFNYFCNRPTVGQITLAFTSDNHDDFTIVGQGTYINGSVVTLPNGTYTIVFNHNNGLSSNTIQYTFNC